MTAHDDSKSISVILPVYNGLPYLKESVASVLKQSHTNFELLIIDDLSTDESYGYLDSLKDDRIQLFSNKINSGLFYNLNTLIKKCNAPLIKLWSQDDIMYSDCLEKIVEFHHRHSQVGFSYSGRDIINEKGEIIPNNVVDNTPEIISRALHTRIAFFTGSIAGNISNVTLSKKVLEQTGLFNESMKISGDFDMWVRIAEKYPVGFINEPLIKLRNHSGQLSRQEKYYAAHMDEDLQVYRYLMKYINAAERKEGRNILRNHKFLFYYTLMTKAFLKGSLKTGMAFYKSLRKHDSIALLSFYFLRNRILFKKKYAGMHIDNLELMKGNVRK